MRNKKSKQKIYCYVDETGQDPRSEIFIAVVVADDTEQNILRQKLTAIEIKAKIGKRKWSRAKWSKSQLIKSRIYLRLVLEESIGTIYFKTFFKPILSYYGAITDTLVRVIKNEAQKDYKAIIYIDGIDKKNIEIINKILRQQNIKSDKPRRATDENEPLIRLADRWAGCIRQALMDSKSDKALLRQAEKNGYLKEIK